MNAICQIFLATSMTKSNLVKTTFLLNVVYYVNIFVRYVLLSADLNAMGSPDKYRVVFYTEQKKGIYLASRFHTFGLHRKAGL
jgi:hypothetical protein